MFARKFVKGMKVKVGDGEFPLNMAAWRQRVMPDRAFQPAADSPTIAFLFRNRPEVMPLLWALVDDFNASQRVWSRLSVEGTPRPI